MITSLLVSSLATHGGLRSNTSDSTDSRESQSASLVHGPAYSVPSESSRRLGRSKNASYLHAASQVQGGPGSRTHGHGKGDRRSGLLRSPDRLHVPKTSGELQHGGNGRGENDRSRPHLSSPAKSNTSQSYALAQRTVPQLSASVGAESLSSGSVRSASCKTRVRGSAGHILPLNISQSQPKA